MKNIFARFFFYKVNFYAKSLENANIYIKISNFSGQCKLLKPSDFEIEKPIQKLLAINLLKGLAKRTPLLITVPEPIKAAHTIQKSFFEKDGAATNQGWFQFKKCFLKGPISENA